MRTSKTVKRWEKTRIQNMVRHQSRRYYARTFSSGKEIWKSLKTSHFSVAKARLAEVVQEHRERTESKGALIAGKMTFAEAAEMHLQSLDANPKLKPATRHYWRQIVAALLKSWPALRNMDAKTITVADCKKWAAGFAKVASPTRYNNTLAALSHVFTNAVEAGARFNNPAAELKRVRVRAKRLTLPSRDQFAQFVAEIETAGAWCSRDCADLVRFLAFTGCRKGEAAEVAWGDVDFTNGRLTVRGDEETGAKNWTVRHVPLIADAGALLRRMRNERTDERETEKVLRVNEAQKAMDNAAERVGMVRITHHDLRHLFATTCIEVGVDIPTVSRWLGHKDGGALAMKTYGHLRNEHSVAQAQKVSFAPAA
jgi:integrase